MTKLLQQTRDFILRILSWFGSLNLLSFSIVSLILVGINFLPLTPQLGYYLDDWPHVYSWTVRGVEGIKQLWMTDNRPFAQWIHLGLFSIYGNAPLGWHIHLAIMRWITSILFWLAFVRIWPRQKVGVTLAALLFAIYPLFMQQSSGLMFSVIWVCFVLFLASLWIMTLTIPMKPRMIPLLILGLGLDLVSLFSYEYFLGLELLRPLLLFILINRQDIKLSKKIVQTFLYSIPWLIISVGFIVWRVILANTSALRSPDVFSSMFTTPLHTVIQLVQNALNDTIQIVISIWYSTFSPALIDFSSPSKMIAWGVSLLAFVLVGIYLYFVHKANPKLEEQKQHSIQLLCVGVLLVVFGAMPGWAIGRTVSDTAVYTNDRFGIASMLGASLCLVSMIAILVKPSQWKTLIIGAIFIGLATGSNFRSANEYRWSATYQTRFYNQLHWRAPSIEPNTTFLSANELFPKMGIYPTAFAINTMYPSTNPMPDVDYWFFSIPHSFPKNFHDLKNGIEISVQKWYAKFSGNSTDSLVIYWKYADPSCLWVLDENDRYNPFLSDYAIKALGASNLPRIHDVENEGYPPEVIFGTEAGHGWCYYFEKADLAKQNHEWEKIPAFYEQALAKGYNTNFAPELTPFIFGYALSGNVDQAVTMTNIAKTMAEKMSPYLCDQWTEIKNVSNSSDQINSAYNQMMETLKCYQ